jgi:ketosteroid isomerase-like protein
MADSNEDVARAISGHSFQAALPSLADDIVWTLVGEEPVRGRDAVVTLLEATAAEVASTTSDFRSFRTFVSGDSVVIDSIAEYVSADGDRTVVASCDIYDFADGMLAEIRSYNIELPE